MLWALLWACAAPGGAVDLDSLQFTASGHHLRRGVPYTGAAVRSEADGGFEHMWLEDGKRSGLRAAYYPDHRMRLMTTYAHGRRTGAAFTWWPDGTLRSESHFEQDVPTGVQRQYYRSGALFKEVRLVEGREVGLQRAWRENGALFNNYEAKNGRIYGLRRSKPCFQLEEEDVVHDGRAAR